MSTRTRTKALVTAVVAVLAAGGYYLSGDLDLNGDDVGDAAATGTADLSELTVTPEDTGAHYDRDDWPHWSSVGDGCDARDAALRNQGRSIDVGDDCDISGEWTSIYDGETVTDPSELDIDHWVPLAEVARSGARDWSEQQREEYANDPDVLVPVTASSNRSKGDQDPATWLPDEDRCGYVTKWVQIKQRYELTVDRAEAEAIRGVLARCE
ncbi:MULTISPECIES: HNH endonuclease family protein [Prauserella salsuginis group]|uniref:GmrSD restriction endonucleases C-terminal domain-containing protein n=2 Tax=Prauserella salsuginis group TaxID=2893672 RepID=A0A839XL10_9PSEU|nr:MULTISPECIES: HNH endonuclease family protein [Prauserella salsuginis group]MBB3662214.1 hypothetical protein [Prauserella sediminis]MCR3719905.1 Protein of unknown function (DUF1524) [Prauserella flava]MCR3736552.1 Protein of unknown function (DUF1524) [Prauserella salsuginis]